MKFCDFFSSSALLYATAALEASAPVTGLVMSMVSLPDPAQPAIRSATAIHLLFEVIVAFPVDAQSLRRRRGAVALADQRPQQPAPLAAVRRHAPAQLAPQRAGGELFLAGSTRGFRDRRGRV